MVGTPKLQQLSRTSTRIMCVWYFFKIFLFYWVGPVQCVKVWVRPGPAGSGHEQWRHSLLFTLHNSGHCLQTKKKGKRKSSAAAVDWGMVETAETGHSYFLCFCSSLMDDDPSFLCFCSSPSLFLTMPLSTVCNRAWSCFLLTKGFHKHKIVFPA